MITSEEPKVSETGRYSVMQASRALGISRDTLRLYTRDGKIRCGYRRTPSARKFYKGSEITPLLEVNLLVCNHF